MSSEPGAGQQLPNKDAELDQRVRSAHAQTAHIPLPPPGKKHPILRTNALPIISAPEKCGILSSSKATTFSIVNEKRKDAQGNILTFTGDVLFWGSVTDVEMAFKDFRPNTLSLKEFDDIISNISDSTVLRSFFEEALATALCSKRPLKLRRSKQRTWYAVVPHGAADDLIFDKLKSAVNPRGNPGPIVGRVPGLANALWAEATSIKLEVKAGSLWLLLRPDVWISPMSERENATAFLRSRKVNRWNAQSYQLLDAWIEILLGSVGRDTVAEVTALPSADYPAEFKIATRTGFSLQI